MALQQHEFNNLIAYLQHPDCKYNNLHTGNRKTSQHKKKISRYLVHINIIKLIKSKRNAVEGYVCGPKVEIIYSINSNGVSISFQRGMSANQAHAYIQSLEKEIMAVVNRGHGNTYPPKRTKGMYYIRRWNNPNITQAANSAVSAGLLTQNFVNIAQKWNFQVIEGQ